VLLAVAAAVWASPRLAQKKLATRGMTI